MHNEVKGLLLMMLALQIFIAIGVVNTWGAAHMRRHHQQQTQQQSPSLLPTPQPTLLSANWVNEWELERGWKAGQ